jgi:hypothetical protein
MLETCPHNQRSRFTHGFFCKDCNTFFENGSDVYRSGELLSSIWMVLHNINVHSVRDGMGEAEDALYMRNKIGIGLQHDDYEGIISEAEIVMEKYGKTSKSASIEIG